MAKIPTKVIDRLKIEVPKFHEKWVSSICYILQLSVIFVIF